jgi:WD40 repeat protein
MRLSPMLSRMLLCLPMGLLVVGCDRASSTSVSTPTSAASRLLSKIDLQTPLPDTTAWSPDSTMVAVGSIIPPIQIWDVSSGKRVATLDEAGANPQGLAWSPNGQYIAAASSAPTITLHIWDVVSAKIVFSASPPSQAASVAWSSDNSSLAVAIGGEPDDLNKILNAAIYIFRTGQWQLEYSIPYTDYVGPLAWASDGKRLAFALTTADLTQSSIGVWDIGSKQQMQKFAAQQKIITGLAWSPDGAFLASASHDHSVAIWSMEDDQKITSFDTGGEVTGIAWSPDSKRLAAAGEAGLVGETATIKIWDVSSRALLTTFVHEDSVTSLAWSPNGDYLASTSADDFLWIWDAK